MNKLWLILITVVISTINLANAQIVDINPDPSQAYTMTELQAMSKTPVVIRTVLGGDYGQYPLDLSGFFLRVDKGFGNGQILIMQTDSDDKRWNDVGVASGMSGSPIFDPTNGKLLGALSYGGDLGYNGKILFYATPIALMNQNLLLNTGKNIRRSNSLFEDDAEQPCNCNEQPSQISTTNPLLPIMISGMSTVLAKKALKNLPNYHLLSSSGFANVNKNDTPLQAGSAIAVPLVTGDAYVIYSIGTATTVFDGKIMAFGHPFLNIGKTVYPLYGAWIDGIEHSPETSKMGVLTGSILGVINRDERVGIAGKLGDSVKPNIIPVHFRAAKGNQVFTYDHQVSKIEFNSSAYGNYMDWAALTLMASLEQSFGTYGTKTAGVRISLKVKGYKNWVTLTNWTIGDEVPYWAGYKAYTFMSEAKSYGFDIAKVSFDASLYHTDQSLYLDKAEIVGRIIAGTATHLKVTAHNSENIQIINDVYIDIPDDTQGKTIKFNIGSTSDLNIDNVLSANPNVRQWAENVANRGQENDLCVKAVIMNSTSDPLIINKSILLNDNVVIGTLIIHSSVE